MKYKDKEFDTFDKIFNEGLRLAKENKEEAKTFFKAYIKYLYDSNKDHYNSIEEATNDAKSNFGYWAGYYSKEVCNIIYETFQCCHPIFGSDPFGVSPDVAFRIGYEMGSK